MIKVYVAVLGPVGTNCYILINEESGEAAIVDAADNADRLLDAVEKKGAKLTKLLLTHAHWDHIGAVNDMIDMTSELPVYIGVNDVPLMENPSQNCSSWLADHPDTVSRDKVITLNDGDELEVLGESVKVIEVPGHTAGGVCYYFKDSGILFCGDTVFQGSIGISHLPSVDVATLISSIKEKLLILPDDTKVYPGHGMGTTIGEEKRSNYYLQ